MSQLPPKPINIEQNNKTNLNDSKCVSSSSNLSKNHFTQLMNQKKLKKQIENDQTLPCLLNTSINNNILTLKDKPTLNTQSNTQNFNVKSLKDYSASTINNHLSKPKIVLPVTSDNILSKQSLKKISTSAPQLPQSSINSTDNSQIFNTQTIASNNVKNKDENLSMTNTTKTTNCSMSSEIVDVIPSKKFSSNFTSR